VREYKFRALITFDAAAGDSAARGYLDGSRTRCIIQPSHQVYLPAEISRFRASPRGAISALLSIRLTDGEAEAYSAVGQRFTIWADALVGRAIWGHGLVGSGVISASSGQRAVHTVPNQRQAAPPGVFAHATARGRA
jgi:hypothetical protein